MAATETQGIEQQVAVEDNVELSSDNTDSDDEATELIEEKNDGQSGVRISLFQFALRGVLLHFFDIT